MTAREWTLDLEYTSVPLSLNYSPGISRSARMGYAAKIKRVRKHGKDLAAAAGIPRLERFSAVLHYQPRDDRKRDPLNLTATLKPLVDGLIDAGICADDDRKHCETPSPVIHNAIRGQGGRMWLVVTDLGHVPGTQTALDIKAVAGG